MIFDRVDDDEARDSRSIIKVYIEKKIGVRCVIRHLVYSAGLAAVR